MRSSRALSLLLLCLVLGLFAACGGGGGGGEGGGGSSSGDSPAPASPAVAGLVNGTSLTPITGDNVLTVTVNGSNCSAATSANYPNKPCVSVTICDTNGIAGGACQTINDVLLDTGDHGFRVFRQAITNVPLLNALDANPVLVGGNELYECVEYGDGSTVWGPVRSARLALGNEETAVLPIHLTGSTYGNYSAVCTGSPLLTQPGAASNQARYNAILGVGLRPRDCGSTCTSVAANSLYYTCPGGTCTGSTVALDKQVQNPVAALPSDNNGVMVAMPSVPSRGASSTTGYLVFGIGTRANNAPSGVTTYGTTSRGYFTTTFRGSTYTSFLDTGSNGLFFPNYGIPLAGAFYAPTATLSLSAVNTGAPSAPNQSTVNFEIENVVTLAATGNMVFSNIGAPAPGYFDWGFPFFLGRNVFVGIDGTSSSLGTGPYWAY